MKDFLGKDNIFDKFTAKVVLRKGVRIILNDIIWIPAFVGMTFKTNKRFEGDLGGENYGKLTKELKGYFKESYKLEKRWIYKNLKNKMFVNN